MNSINSLDNRMVEEIANIKKDLYKLSTARQPYEGSWIELSPTDFVDLSVNPLIVTGFLANEKLSIGNKIRTIYNGFQQDWYIYFIDQTSNKIYLKFVSTKSVDPSITKIFYSSEANPTGFHYTSGVTYAPVYGATSTYINDGDLWMEGSMIYFTVSIFADISSVAKIEIDLPLFAPINAFINGTGINPVSLNISDGSIIYAATAKINQTTQRVEITRDDGINWPVITSWRANLYMSYYFSQI